jgi:dihydrofolate synthase/folylpolyglutamate synthase
MNKPENYLNLIDELYNRNTNPKLGLSRIEKLLDIIGFKRENFNIIQVVGTNGKGSTCAFLESLLIENGIATGLFTSPHLSSVRERIRINKKIISQEDFTKALKEVLKASKKLTDEASFFECMLAMALWVFQKKEIKAVILEAGLGGRLDATTATKPDIIGISTIDLDHQHILGETIDKIALEKIKASFRGQTVISVSQNPKAMQVILKAQKDIGFNLIKAKKCFLPLGLFGDHQKLNAGLALELLKTKFKTDEKKNTLGLLKVSWPGRFEIIKDIVPIILDGAHNPSGMKVLINSLSAHALTKNKPLVVIYGSMSGDNALNKIEILASIMPKKVLLHVPRNPRALDINKLKELCLKTGIDNMLFKNLEEAKHIALLHNAVLVITGSLYTVGELRSALLGITQDEKILNF